MTAASQGADGLLGLLKPPGMTSHDVVALCRRALGTREVGHAGTLDPAAAGVLPVLVGSATRLAEQLTWPAKEYRAEVLFGVSSSTGDLAGELTVLDHAPPPPPVDLLDAAIGSLVGDRAQVPPAYSARKVAGRKLYELARAGQLDPATQQKASRQVAVYSARLVEHRPLGWGRFVDHPAALVDITCSSGTYVRELAERLGEACGTVACLAFLLRRRCAGLTLADCLPVDNLAIPSGLPPVERFRREWRTPAAALSFLPAYLAAGDEALRIANGVPSPLAVYGGEGLADGPAVDAAGKAAPLAAGAGQWCRVLAEDGVLLALGTVEPAATAAMEAGRANVRPRKVFHR